MATLRMGFDDTDSPGGMCTTFLAYKAVGALMRADARLVDFPWLVRFNPNVPWKTRGNGAVSLSVETSDPDAAKGIVRDLIMGHAAIRDGANPGLVFLEGESVPPEFADFGSAALWKLVSRGSARSFARDCNLDFSYLGNGQGLVGAIGAVGYRFADHTLEMISYRRPHMIGKKRMVDADSVEAMQNALPATYGSFDPRRKRVLIAPRGPDPVLYGIRGEDADSLIRASGMVDPGEIPDGYMIFRSNQGTGDHLRNELDGDTMLPYYSGYVSGTVSGEPLVGRGGHVAFGVESGGSVFECAVYKPTGITAVAAQLAPGDAVRVGGGVRRASKNRPRVINAEFIEVLGTAKRYVMRNPLCAACQKRMKSKGRGQGFECVRCKARAPRKMREPAPPAVQKGLYLPDLSAHRHLTRPLQRIGRVNRPRFEASAPWFCVYDDANSGE